MQLFKGDAQELKFKAVGDPLLDITNAALNDFYAGCYEAAPFLLMLYDNDRIPFSNRIPRAAFVDFIVEALKNFPFTGTFDSYLFVLKAVFGSLSEIFFDIDSPGKLSIDIGASASAEFEFIGRDLVLGEYSYFNICDDDLNDLIFRGLPGISSEQELVLLLSEIIPAGISPTIALQFYERSDFVAEESSVFYNMVTNLNDQIVFYEIGEI